MEQRIEPGPGTTVDTLAETAVAQANATGEPVTMVFNGAETTVKPGENGRDVAQQAIEDARRR